MSENADRGVLYIGHLPHGFFEVQLRRFFRQFGKILQLRVARNKVGRSKHFAFVEFQSREIASIVASAMNNYMMFGHTLKCSVLEAKHIHSGLFKNADKKFVLINKVKIARNQHNQLRSVEQTKKLRSNLVGKENKKRKALQELGIEYEFPGYVSQCNAFIHSFIHSVIN